jgi:hypothetical protein
MNNTITHLLNSTVARYTNTKINGKCYLAIHTLKPSKILLKPPKTTLKPFLLTITTAIMNNTITHSLNSTVARYTNTKINGKCYLAIRTLKPSKILLKPPKTTLKPFLLTITTAIMNNTIAHTLNSTATCYTNYVMFSIAIYFFAVIR